VFSISKSSTVLAVYLAGIATEHVWHSRPAPAAAVITTWCSQTDRCSTQVFSF